MPATTLDVPLRERNRILEAAGYAGVYRQTPLAADEMSHVRGVLQFILDRHEPHAAVVLDRYANCVMGNASSMQLLRGLVDPSLLGGLALAAVPGPTRSSPDYLVGTSK